MSRGIRLASLGTCLAAFAAGFGCRSASEAGVRFPPLRIVAPPPVVRKTLPNGIRLLLVEDPDFPTVDVRVLIGAGSVADPPEKRGLASLAAEVIRSGGTQALPGDALDDELERIAASLSIHADIDVTVASLSLLQEDADRGLAILSEVLGHPAFPEPKIGLAKVRMRTAIARRNDDPDGIAEREFRAEIYGRGSPYAAWPEYATIDAIGREDLAAFHARYFHPGNLLIGVWGDFEAEAMGARIAEAFAGWSGEGDALVRPEVAYDWKREVLLVRRPEVTQSSIRLGHIAARADHPDYPALSVLSVILGRDRLWKEVRESRGLAYAVSGAYGVEYRYPGIFEVSSRTRTEKTVEVIRIIQDEIRRIAAEPVSEEELARAKDTFRNRMAFLFETKESVVDRLLRYAYYGYPEDFSQRILKAIDGVTADDVLRVAREHLHPEALRVLVVGDAERFDEALGTIGETRELDVSIPPPADPAGEGSGDGP
ncbi:MAG: insulinase family protein [Planctomycetes bacterium]|nr:insulinase family protein [Planctomycetota bacterium]